MRFSQFGFGFVYLFGYVNAQANLTIVGQQLSLMPACGLGCLTEKIPLVGCSLTNISCQCESLQLVDITSSCLYANCTLRDTLDTSKSIAAICERPSESKNQMLRIMTYVCATITNGAVFIRFLVRWLLHQRIRLDDYFIILAIIAAGVFTYFGVLFEHNGFGTHIWDTDFDVVPDLLYWFYITQALYIMTIGAVKLSLLFFYLNVFPRKAFRTACFSTIGFVLACMVAFILAGVFQCSPISHAWRLDIAGKCINYNAVAWANAGTNIFQDIIIILLPIRELRNIQISSRKMKQLYLMFGVGSFATITSIIRLYSLKRFGLTPDPTWDNIPTIFWSTIETTSSVFCACMPAMRAGLVRLFPKMFGGTNFFKSSGGSSTWGSKVSRSNREAVHQRWLSRDINGHSRNNSIMLGSKQGENFVRLPEPDLVAGSERVRDNDRKRAKPGHELDDLSPIHPKD